MHSERTNESEDERIKNTLSDSTDLQTALAIVTDVVLSGNNFTRPTVSRNRGKLLLTQWIIGTFLDCLVSNRPGHCWSSVQSPFLSSRHYAFPSLFVIISVQLSMTASLERLEQYGSRRRRTKRVREALECPRACHVYPSGMICEK